MLKIEIKCVCGKTFSVYPYRRLTAKYCSSVCQKKYRKFRSSGYKCPQGSLAKMGIKNPMFGKEQELNPMWKGGSYSSLHGWVKRRFTKPDRCEICGKIKKINLANKSHEYKKEISDWLWLCHKCHMEYDGYGKYLELGRKRKSLKQTNNHLLDIR
jgi:hypothetical protein